MPATSPRRFAHRDFLEVFGYNMCVLFPFFFYSNGIISTFSMACIAVNRFVGIYFSRKMSHWFSAAKSWAMVAGVWLLAYALLALPASGAWGQVGDSLTETDFVCGQIWRQFCISRWATSQRRSPAL